MSLTLRTRIFLSITALILISSAFMASITIFHFREENKNYHEERLMRKETAVRASIDYFLQQESPVQRTDSLVQLFDTKICELADINSLDINIYSLQGELLISSKPGLFEAGVLPEILPLSLLDSLGQDPQGHFVQHVFPGNEHYHNTFLFLKSPTGKRIGIVNIPYFQDNRFHEQELSEFLSSIIWVFLGLLLMGMALAYYISNYITRSLREVSANIRLLQIDGKNERIEWGRNDEIGRLVEQYNQKVDELEASAALIAKSEREQAWKKMARQVAHEIKNPLTPIKLSIQRIKRLSESGAQMDSNEINRFLDGLIVQVDTLAKIADTFSSFANFSNPKMEVVSLNELITQVVSIYDAATIRFEAEGDLHVLGDHEQLVRILNNLINNALDAVQNTENPMVEVRLSAVDGKASGMHHKSSEPTAARIEVIDNGVGIPQDVIDLIFEPNFTTKTSGTGLGLAMVKALVEGMKGHIRVHQNENNGATFTFELPVVSIS